MSVNTELEFTQHVKAADDTLAFLKFNFMSFIKLNKLLFTRAVYVTQMSDDLFDQIRDIYTIVKEREKRNILRYLQCASMFYCRYTRSVLQLESLARYLWIFAQNKNLKDRQHDGLHISCKSAILAVALSATATTRRDRAK